MWACRSRWPSLTRVAIYDLTESAVALVNSGRLPFAEPGAKEVLHRVLGAGLHEASADPAIVGRRSMSW